MKPQWFFRAMQPSEINIDPIQAEFFTTEAVGNSASALVRESVQNSLDAASGDSKVRVRLFLATDGPTLAAPEDEFFEGLWRHLKARGTGLQPHDLPDPCSAMPFLVVEDFGTSGLTGDASQFEDSSTDGRGNNFYYFWRNVGRSGKGERDRGRWGVGKYVLPACSRVNTFFGMTLRRDDEKRLLMGQAVLKVHQLDKQRHYPYGYFGLLDSDRPVMPVEAPSLLERFSKTFNLQRGREPGLSVVIPYPDPEITEQALLVAAVRQYCFAVIWDQLAITIETPSTARTLTAATIRNLVREVGGQLEAEMGDLLDFAAWAGRVSEQEFIELPSPEVDDLPKFDKLPITKSEADRLRELFSRGERIALRLPVWVVKRGEDAVRSTFHVFIEPDSEARMLGPCFIREGITIPGVRAGVQSGVRCLVVAHDGPLAVLLGDSENPAHTEWQERAPRLKARYVNGVSLIRYVRNAPARIIDLIANASQQTDPKALADVFFLPESTDADVRPAVSASGVPDDQVLPPAGLQSKSQWIRVHPIDGGFVIKGAAAPPTPNALLEARVAYEVRRGNPFKRYITADFSLTSPPITVVTKDCEIVKSADNRLVLRVSGPSFETRVQGFDPHRDICVRVVARQAEDETDS